MGSVSQEGNIGNVNNRGAGDSIEVSLDYGFEVGDMVWGKVKSHPWWPGHVYSEELATPSVRRSKKDGLLLVAFFGDSSYGWFDSSELMPFDSNFAEKSLQTNSKTFVKALEEAIDEVRRRSALGLSCMCRNEQNFRKTDAQGFVAVDVVDYEPGAVYSINTIRKARESFQPRLALDFVRELALEPTDEHDDIDFIKNKAIVMSYRRAVYYDQAFGGDLIRPLPASIQVSTSGKKPSKAPLSGRQVFSDTPSKLKTPANAKPNKPKTDKYLFKRRQKVKESTPEDIEDPILATLKVSTNEDTSKPIIVPESSNNPLDFEINIPIISLIHKSSNLQKLVTQNGFPNSHPLKISSPEKKIKKRKKESSMEKVDLLEEQKKRKKESLIHDHDHDGDSPEMELPRVLADLHSLALDPFHTNNRKLRQIFLKFRSLVFQKSLNSVTQNGIKSPVVAGAPPVKPPPPPPLSGGIKRDHDEETVVKKKKIKKIDEDGGRQTAVVKPRKSGQEVGQRVEEEERTTLKMEFPSGESLPSISELKAKLGRYGTMDHDGTRIYWKTFTCLVVYKYKADALAALKAVTATGSSSCSLFGSTNVKYSLKEISNSEPPDKVSDRQLLVEDTAAVVVVVDTPVKSCLKKSGGGEDGGRKISRVKFNLARDERVSVAPPPPPPLVPLQPLPLASPPPPRRSMNYIKPSAPPSLPPQSMLVAPLPSPPPLVPLQPPPLASPPRQRRSMNYSKPSASPSLPPQSMLVVPPPSPPPLVPLQPPPLAFPPPQRRSMNYSKPSAPPSLPPQSMLVVPPPSPPPLVPLQPPPLASPPPQRRSMNYNKPLAPPSLLPQSMLVAPPPPPPRPLAPAPRLNRPAAMPPAPLRPNVDIAQQMVSLLTRCNDVVAHVTGILGYVPYHPL